MEKATTRLEVFSDGIFAVAITLLAIEIGIKEYDGATNPNLWHRILDKWPEYFAYFNSFATLLLVWMGHHNFFVHLRLVNRWIMLLNGFVLLLVVLFPYPSRTVGEFIGTNAAGTAVAFYAGFTGLLTISMLTLNVAIIRHPHVLESPEKSLPVLKALIPQQAVGAVLYFIVAGLAFYFPLVALGITFLMWVFWFFITREMVIR